MGMQHRHGAQTPPQPRPPTPREREDERMRCSRLMAHLDREAEELLADMRVARYPGTITVKLLCSNGIGVFKSMLSSQAGWIVCSTKPSRGSGQAWALLTDGTWAVGSASVHNCNPFRAYRWLPEHSSSEDLEVVLAQLREFRRHRSS